MKKIEILGKRYYVLTEEETHNVHGSAARIISSDLMVEIIAILYGLTLSFPYTGNSYFELSDRGKDLIHQIKQALQELEQAKSFDDA